MCGQGRPAAADEAGSTGLDWSRYPHDCVSWGALGCVVRFVCSGDPAQAQRMSVRRNRCRRRSSSIEYQWSPLDSSSLLVAAPALDLARRSGRCGRRHSRAQTPRPSEDGCRQSGTPCRAATRRARRRRRPRCCCSRPPPRAHDKVVARAHRPLVRGCRAPVCS